MKAVPIAQYLDQKSRAATAEILPVRREASPLTARLAPPANDSRPQTAAVFRRVSRAASRPAEEEGQPDPRRAERESPPRETSVFRPRETAPPSPDLEAQLAAAYHRGVQEGLDAAKEEAANARAQERAELQKHAVVERLDFQMNEYARLAEQISSGLIEIERRIADVVARLLQPFVSQAIANQVVEELATNIARLRSAGSPGLMKIRGPEALVNALKSRVADLAIDVEYVVEEGVEITVEAQPTSISSQIARWTELLATLVETA
jgi:hypothetical protein